MYYVPSNTSTIHIPLIKTGCCEWEFDSNYPIQLNGIIRQEEFVESIENLNRAINAKKDSIFCWILVIVCLILGSILFIVGGILANVSRSSFYSIMVAIGIGVCVVGCLIICCCSYIIQSKVDNRLRQAIRQESQKYSNSNTAPCSWRLDTMRGLHSSYFSRRNRRPPYHLMIDIGAPMPNGYQSHARHYNQIAPEPPPYSMTSKPPLANTHN